MIGAAMALLVAWPTVARADAGIPMLMLVWPPAWALFVPIVVVEALVARRLLALPYLECARLSLVANARSTIIGIPLTWLVLVLLEMTLGMALASLVQSSALGQFFLVPLSSAWLMPNAKRWQVYLAAAILCVPFLLVSIRLERWSAARSIPADQARRWAKAANLATYLPIIAGLLVLSVFSWYRPPAGELQRARLHSGAPPSPAPPNVPQPPTRGPS